MGVILAGLASEPERRSLAAPTLRELTARDPLRLVDAIAERGAEFPHPIWETRRRHDGRDEVSLVIVYVGYAHTSLPAGALDAAGRGSGLLEATRASLARSLLALYADWVEESDAEVERLKAEMEERRAENRAKLPEHLRKGPGLIANDPFPPDDLELPPSAVPQRRLI